MKIRRIISVFASVSIMLSSAVYVPKTVQAAPNSPVQVIQLSGLTGNAYIEPIASAYTLGDGPEDVHKNWLQASYSSTDRLYSMSTSTSNTAGDGYAIKIQKDNNLAELAINGSGSTHIVAKYWLKDATNANDVAEVIQYSSDGGTSYQSLPDKNYPSASIRTHRLTGADNNPNLKIRINGSLPVRKGHIVWLDHISIFSDTTAPIWNNPSLQASNVTDTSLKLSWDAALDNVNSLESGVRDYRIYKDSELLATVTNDVYYTVTGLKANQTYGFTIQAGDVAGNWSSTGPTSTFSTAASSDMTPPQWSSAELTYTNLGQRSLTLNWGGAQDETAVQGYRVYQNSVPLDTVSASVYSYDIQGLSPQTGYTFKVEAVDVAGNWTNNGPSNQLTTLAPGIPLLQESFENGTIPSRWELSQSGGTIKLVNDPLNLQGKCLELIDTSASNSVSAKYGIGQKTGAITVEYRFMHKDAVGTMYLPVYGSISGGADRELFRLSTGTGNMLTYGNDANAYTNISVIQANKWYTAKVVVDINKKVSYFSITGEDGIRYVSDVNKLYGISSSPYTPITMNKIGFYTKSTDTAQLYIDEIKVYDTNLALDIPIWPSEKELKATDINKKDVTLEWSEAGDYLGVKYYGIYKDHVKQGVVPSTTRSYVVSGLDPGTMYNFKVEAEDAMGNPSIGGPELPVTTLPKDETEPPAWGNGSLSAPAEYIDANTLKLVWTPATDNTGITAYRIYQDGNLIATVTGDVVSYTVTGLAQTTGYTFRVSAGDASDNWAEGPELEISTIGDIKPPVWNSASFGMESTSNTTGSLAFSWSGASDNVGVTQYKVYEGETLLGTVAQASFTHAGVTPGEKHTYTVMAGDAAGNWSTNNPRATFQAYDPILPEWQSGTLTALDVGPSDLTLQWSGAVDNGKVSKYRIYRDGVLEDTVERDVSRYTVKGLFHDTSYAFRVQAVDGMNNESKDGPATSISTAHSEDTTKPAWPAKFLEATDITSNSVMLNWSGAADNTGVAGYRIYSGNNLVKTIYENATTYTVNGLAPGLTYHYTIQAVDAAGNLSSEGPSVEATTTPRFGTTRYAVSIDELNGAIAMAEPGDIIILQNGTYETGTIAPIVDKHGLPNERIIIRAADADRAEIKAVTGFTITNSSFITIEGIKFSGKQTKASNQAAINMFGCNNMRITQCHFVLDESQAQSESGYSLAWVTVKSADNVVSHHNQMDRNLFEKKLAPGVMLSIDGDAECKQVSQYDVIEYNHFKDSKPRVDNGKEAIRYGTSYNSQSSAFGIVQYNLFEECDGDPEYLSIKSSDVTIRYNTFLNSMGQFTFRHGDRNTAYGNYFIGDGVKSGVGGFRVYGTDHKIFSNYFQGLTAQTLQIDGGDSYYNGKLTDKWTIRRMQVSFNTLINCAYGITIWGGREYAPQDITIANNLVLNSGGISYTTSKSAVAGIPTPRPTYQGNMVYPTLYPSGKTKAEANDPVTAQEVLLIDPKMELSGSIYRPSAFSPAMGGAMGNYTYVTTDIDGQKIGSPTDVGADQIVTSDINNRPLTAPDVGIQRSTDAPVWQNGRLSASEIKTTSVKLTWEGAGDNKAVTQYRIYSGNRQMASVVGNVYSAVISGLQANAQYTFQVQAVDEDGNMNWQGPAVTTKTLTNHPNPGNHNPNPGPVVSTPAPVNDSKIVKVEPVLAGESGTEAKAVIEKEVLVKAFEKAEPDGRGNRIITVEISEIPGANSYAVVLPAELLTSNGFTKKMEIKTAVASVTIPENMLLKSNIEKAGDVTLRIAAGDLSGLPEALYTKVGAHPVTDVSISSKGNTLEFRNGEVPVQVSIPYKPQGEETNNHEFITVWHIDRQGRQAPVYSGKYDEKTGAVSFTAAQLGQYAVVYVEKSFEDLENFAWAQKSVEVLASKGIINGKEEKRFDPGANITRGDFTLLLVKTLGLTANIEGNFADISAEDYYFEAIGVAKALGIIKGQGEGKFNPKEEITRQDMMTITARAMMLAKKLTVEGESADIDQFSDRTAVADYAVQSAVALVRAGLIQGSNGQILPMNNATRAELAVLLYRIYNK